MISSIAWVKKGTAKSSPDKFVLDEEEYQKICDMAQQKLSLAKNDLEESSSSKIDSTVEDSEVINEYNLDDYDKDEEGNCITEDHSFFDLMGKVNVDTEESKDPHISLEESEDEDKEDLQIKNTDSMILVGKTDEDLSHLECYIYDSEQDNLYVHHDIMLPSFPLAIEPICYQFGEEYKNYCAIGTFESEIEIWNLDLLDAMFPAMILGQNSVKKGKGKRLPQSHTDAVLALSSNAMKKNILGSASADHTVLIWNLSSEVSGDKRAIQCIRHHSDKVSSIEFHSEFSELVITGGYDKKIFLSDLRQESPSEEQILSSDIECIRWDPHDGNRFVVGCDSGIVQSFDIRSMNTPLFTLSAHDSSITSLDLNCQIPGFMLTSAASNEDPLKFWDIAENKPVYLGHRDVGAGKVLACGFCPDDPYYCSIGGSEGSLSVLNITESKKIRNRFHGRESKHFINSKVRMDMQNALMIEKIKQKDEDDMSEDSDTDVEARLEEIAGFAGK